MGGGEVRFLDTTTPGEQVRQEAADQGGRLREVRENQTADQGIDGPVAESSAASSTLSWFASPQCASARAHGDGLGGYPTGLAFGAVTTRLCG